ncbi:hypothetical protein XM79_u0126 [Vibrio vulnificus]|nr:hypothetical protein XM79_u0126 [Vibrio vulnificus]
MSRRSPTAVMGSGRTAVRIMRLQQQAAISEKGGVM